MIQDHASALIFSGGKPYFPLSQRYQDLFGKKVFKVSVSTAKTCPNREGRGGMKVCTFCDEWGSAAYHLNAQLPLEEQIRQNQQAIRARYKAEKFLVYFQAYTNTFGHMKELEDLYQVALDQEDVIGLVVGTRPDCLSTRVLKIFERIAQTHFLSVELGVQTLDDPQLQFLSRGHDSACSIQAIHKLKQIPSIDICVHLMFGLPGETTEQLRQTAQTLSDLEVHGVKLHNLHVLQKTPLADLFYQGAFTPIELEPYAHRVSVFLEHLSPCIAVHRLVAVASRWDELIAPMWSKERMRPSQFIEEYLKSVPTWQGRYYRSKPEI